MTDRNWDEEMKKIDRQIEGVTGPALSAPVNVRGNTERSAASVPQVTTTHFGVFARVTLAVVLGVAIIFWPYSARCGLGLYAYLASVLVVVVGGGWASVWTWRHRAAKGHTLSLLIVLWGLVLGAIDVLPRIGYAKPMATHPATWTCS
jgi:hypothetical protein